MRRPNDVLLVRIDSRFGSALLTGDIEAKTEMVLLRTSSALLHADVLLVPHHGSVRPSTAAFIRAVGPPSP